MIKMKKNILIFVFTSCFLQLKSSDDCEFMIQKKFGKFCNSLEEKISKHFADAIHVFFRTKANRSPYFHENFNLKDWFVKDTKPQNSSSKPVITWVGHSSFLIQIGGINILTDPVFYDLSVLYPRNFPPGISLENLPAIDVVLISHNHRDHLDLRSLIALKSSSPVIFVPLKTKKLLKKHGLKNVVEFEWGSSQEIKNKEGESVKLTFLPTVHWTSRGMLDLNNFLWGSWLIDKDDFKIYFAGDSAYSDYYTEIAGKFPSIDVAIMPISPNKPRKLTKHAHMSAGEAMQAFLDLGAKRIIPMHWGTFRLGLDHFDEPIKILRNWWDENEEKLKGKELYIPKFGEEVWF